MASEVELITDLTIPTSAMSTSDARPLDLLWALFPSKVWGAGSSETQKSESHPGNNDDGIVDISSFSLLSFPRLLHVIHHADVKVGEGRNLEFGG